MDSADELSVAIAPDSFKGSINAVDAAAAIAAGWASVRPHDRLQLTPLADGGEGTLDAIEASVTGSARMSAGSVTGPDGRPTPGEWLQLPDGTAVVELAQSSGLPLMAAPDAMSATTYGMGEVIRAALDAGAQRIIVGAGGSASTDAAAGALVALGLRMLGTNSELALGGGALAKVVALDRSSLRTPPPGGVLVLSDVTAPLFGPTGAAAVFGPQKGADAAQVARLDDALRHFAALFGGDPHQPGAGAAGGVGYGFATAWGATVTSGARYLLTLTGADETIRDADVVLTGEGRFDETSFGGKIVGEVVRLAATGSARIGIIAGVVDPPPSAPGMPSWTAALVDLAGSASAAMSDPKRWLTAAGASAARELGGTPAT